jgi:hypothetical protein
MLCHLIIICHYIFQVVMSLKLAIIRSSQPINITFFFGVNLVFDSLNVSIAITNKIYISYHKKIKNAYPNQMFICYQKVLNRQKFTKSALTKWFILYCKMFRKYYTELSTRKWWMQYAMHHCYLFDCHHDW